MDEDLGIEACRNADRTWPMQAREDGHSVDSMLAQSVKVVVPVSVVSSVRCEVVAVVLVVIMLDVFP